VPTRRHRGMELTISGGDLLVLHENLFGQDGVRPGWHADAGVVMLGCAAALFVVAGVVRLARWRLVHDPHSALVGSALIVMGALGLPLVGVAAVAGALQHRELADAAVRALASLIIVGLVYGALRATSVPWARPSRLLPLLATVVLIAFAGLAAVEAALSGPVPGGPVIARVLSAVMVLGWFAIAALTRAHGSTTGPWSRRAAPLFCGLGIAEALYGSDVGGDVGTTASLIVCTAVAVLCVRSAHLDLTTALQDTERAIGSLRQTLVDVRDQAVELTQWRASLVHDASNSVAGLQAALGVLDSRHGDDAATTRLRRAAVEEVRHLDHLLHRSPDETCELFDVGSLVQRIGESARALGTEVSVRAESAPALGRPGDVVAVLKNLLVNACRHAPGAPVELSVESAGGQIRIVCADDGPGLDDVTARHAFDRGYRGPASEGSGLGLHDARQRMRAQGGDLVLEAGNRGARFIATLPAPAYSVGRVPSQRSGSPATQDVDLATWSVR
jgi:signal transduction histidine kinase